MTPATAFAGRTLALFGLGGSGLATARALEAGGARVLCWDDAEAARRLAVSEGLEVADLHAVDWTTVRSLVLSPGVPLTHPEPHWAARLAQAAGVEVIGDIELFCRERARIAPGAPFVAVTGTNGKSTTTALLSHILRGADWDVQMGGNIGTAILDLEPPAPARVHVIEVSSYQIDLAPSLNPTIGLLLNLTPDHIDRHGSMEHYAAVKERLIAGATWCLVSIDDRHCLAAFERAMQREIAAHAHGKPAGRQFPVSTRQHLVSGVSLDGSWVVVHPYDDRDRVMVTLDEIATLRGSHNAQNACFAAGAAHILGAPLEAIRHGLESFPGLPHRMEVVGRRGDVIFVNDSKATNAASTEKALQCFERIFWILGGKPKAGGITALARYFSRIERAYLIGEAAPAFAATLTGQVPYTLSGTLEAAVRQAAVDAAGTPGSGKIVLLSPACASFDQFPNFEARGDRFRALVSAFPV